MLVIGICDADTAVRAMLAGYIKRYRETSDEVVSVLSYDAGEKLLKHYPLEMDIIFLEIPFPRMNGIEIARRIRQVDPQVGIIFLTTVLSHALEAYEVRADNYFIKPLRYEKFLMEIERARARRNQSRYFIEQHGDTFYKIYCKSIRYIETEGRMVVIHTESEAIPSKRRMKELEAMLFDPHFVRCHAGFIVNLYFFQKLESSSLLLLTGERIPVSRQRRGAVVEHLSFLWRD